MRYGEMKSFGSDMMLLEKKDWSCFRNRTFLYRYNVQCMSRKNILATLYPFWGCLISHIKHIRKIFRVTLQTFSVMMVWKSIRCQKTTKCHCLIQSHQRETLIGCVSWYQTINVIITSNSYRNCNFHFLQVLFVIFRTQNSLAQNLLLLSRLELQRFVCL